HMLSGIEDAGRWSLIRRAAPSPASAAEASSETLEDIARVLLPRRQLASWSSLGTNAVNDAPKLTSRAQAIADHLAQHGASFFDEIVDGTRLLHAEAEDALAELVGAGLVGADSFSGLRAMLLPSSKRNNGRHRRLRRHMLSGIEDAGRWSLIRRAASSPSPASAAGASPETLEDIARVLLRRWGVVFWTLLQREAAWLPPWRELRRVYQRLEARGEIRGGRFVSGMAGEQFALPEAIGALRTARKTHDENLIAISGADPLNLVGSVLPGEKVPALAGSRVVLRDGLPLARCVAGEVTLLAELPADDERAVRACLRGAAHGVSVSA
ncbi:MAG: ATP-dependent DNA helicase, partial [Proteobacteria bacterium]|nr:ATP-dependent DNA helicase [Pseudomonadota bacterium]